MPQIDKAAWYAQPAPPAPPAPKKKKLKPVFWAAGVLILLVIAALCIHEAARRMEPQPDRASAASQSDAAQEDLPDSRFDFFDSYYTGSGDINIPKTPAGSGMTLAFAPAGAQSLTLQQIYAAVSPAVVGVATFLNGQEYSTGTGVVFAADGYILTNEHVLSGADAAVVTFSDGSQYDALLVGGDASTDLAVLKIEATGLVCAAFADSASCAVGDPVAAIGNPLGMDYANTMTDGIISGIDRSVSNNGHTMTLLQTNAALNEGNSGGPLLNARGQVVGITNMKIMSYYTSVEGIGFAIPTNVVKASVDEILAYGVVRGAPTIGITAGGIPQEAMAQYDLPSGIYVSAVNEASDAYAKGLKPGDVITAVNGTAVSSVAEVNAIKEGCAVGDALTLSVYREGKSFELEVVLVDSSLIG